MFRVLDCAEIGMELTESLAMLPAASVCGFYFSHPAVDLLQRRHDRRRPDGRPGPRADERLDEDAERALPQAI